MSDDDLAGRQAALVAALVAGGPTPPGFDGRRVRSAAAALLRKRAAEVATAWPLLRASLGPRWGPEFATWAAARPPQGSLRDGWDFARHIAAKAGLEAAAQEELVEHEVRWRYDGASPPRRRRLPHGRRSPRGLVIQVLGRIRRYDRIHRYEPRVR
jgi:hypothetical protein